MEPNELPMNRLLSIDGGGIRGFVAIEILKELEKQLAKKYLKEKDFRLCQYFNFIGGTSVGSIIASMLCLGWSMEEVEREFKQVARKIFKKDWIHRQVQWTYTGKQLEEYLKEKYVRKDDNGHPILLGDPELQSLLLVVSHNASTGSPWLITNNPEAKYSRIDRPDCNLGYPLWKVVRSSTAAPVFFPPEPIVMSCNEDGTPKKVGEFVDGGITALNNPAFQMFLKATLPKYRICMDPEEDDMLIVSVGTGKSITNFPPGGVNELHTIEFANLAVEALMDASVVLQDILCRERGDYQNDPPEAIDREIGTLRGEGRKEFAYFRFDPPLDRFVSLADIKEIGYLRGQAKNYLSKINCSPYELQIEGLDSEYNLPDEGQSLIFVGQSKSGLQIRIFDPHGILVGDIREQDWRKTPDQVSQLKKNKRNDELNALARKQEHFTSLKNYLADRIELQKQLTKIKEKLAAEPDREDYEKRFKNKKKELNEKEQRIKDLAASIADHHSIVDKFPRAGLWEQPSQIPDRDDNVETAKRIARNNRIHLLKRYKLDESDERAAKAERREQKTLYPSKAKITPVSEPERFPAVEEWRQVAAIVLTAVWIGLFFFLWLRFDVQGGKVWEFLTGIGKEPLSWQKPYGQGLCALLLSCLCGLFLAFQCRTHNLRGWLQFCLVLLSALSIIGILYFATHLADLGQPQIRRTVFIITGILGLGGFAAVLLLLAWRRWLAGIIPLLLGLMLGFASTFLITVEIHRIVLVPLLFFAISVAGVHLMWFGRADRRSIHLRSLEKNTSK